MTKGQVISKGLFGVLKFSQKTNERIRRSSKNEFVRLFFGRIRGYQKSFRHYLTFRGGNYSRVQKSIEKWSLCSKMALGEVDVSLP